MSELSRKLGIGTPKIGVVEDLRPNAFTIGYGKGATIVFSVGLLNILNDEEVAAVTSHELAHLKNHDFFYKLLLSALTIVSYFNPFAYVASSAAQREREMLADKRAIQVLEKPNALATALAKICKTIQTLPKENCIVNLSSNLLVTSSVLRRLSVFSAHPRLDKRLRNISEPKVHWHSNRQRTCLSLFLSILLIGVVVSVSYGMVNLQVNFKSSGFSNLVSASAEAMCASSGSSTSSGILAQPGETAGFLNSNYSASAELNANGLVSVDYARP